MPVSLNFQVSVVLVALAALELSLLRRGQRRLFWATATATRSRLIAYLLAAPGTALHEASHYLACLALGVPVLERPRLFWPRRDPQGDVILGSVPHARTDPLRQALISVAPLVLVPALLTLITAVLIAPQALTQLPDALTGVPWWRAGLWVYLSLSCGQAVFPSPGDRIGAGGLLALAGLVATAMLAVAALGGGDAIRAVLATVVGILFLPALAAACSLLALSLISRAAPRH